jgi:hypothetical protein
MKPLNVALLISHDTGITESYWRPTEKEVLADYLKAGGCLRLMIVLKQRQNYKNK